MSPQETAQILTNLVNQLKQQRESCVISGNLEMVVKLDADISSTEATLALLSN